VIDGCRKEAASVKEARQGERNEEEAGGKKLEKTETRGYSYVTKVVKNLGDGIADGALYRCANVMTSGKQATCMACVLWLSWGYDVCSLVGF
jgi:hypothetical protein